MIRALLLLSLLTACAAQQVSPDDARDKARQIKQTSSAALWRIHGSTSDQNELAQAEAELGTRGQFRNGSAYLGRRTLTQAGKVRFRRPSQDDPSLDGVNCSDFLSQAAAQVEFLGSGGPINDRHKLDNDGDGFACGWADELRRSATRGRGGRSR